MKQVEFKLEIPDRCPRCNNPNSNVDGSIYAEEFKVTIKCMQCGMKHQENKLRLNARRIHPLQQSMVHPLQAINK